MLALRPNTILQRVPDLKLHIDSSNHVQIATSAGTLHCGPRGLAILDVFSQPTSFSEALKKLQAHVKGAQDWVDLTNTITQLYRAEILQDEARAKPTLSVAGESFAAARIHVAMLNDRVRTSRFLAGIREVVRPGDIVVDIGTGTGVLAVAAARAGARQVYAVEASNIGTSAKTIFEMNGLADRITLVRGWSTQINLPERADVLVTETIGNEPLGERILELTTDALKRLLKPDARLVPSRVKVFGLPITIPRAEIMKYQFTPEVLQNWHSWYDIDFSPLAQATRDSSPLFYINPSSAANWKTLSEPILLADLDLKVPEQFVINNTQTVTANTSGQLDGLVAYFELELSPTTRLLTHPAETDRSCSWRSPVWVLDAPLFLPRGHRFTVTYKYRVAGAPDGVSISSM